MVVDMPGFSDPKNDVAYAQAFAEWVSETDSISCFLFLIGETPRFTDKTNKTILAVLLRLFGEKLFNHLIVIVNRWSMNPSKSEIMKRNKSYGGDPQKAFADDIHQVCFGFKQKPSNEQVYFVDNWYDLSATFQWEAFEYELFKYVASKEPLVITTEIRDKCDYYRSHTSELFSFDDSVFDNPALMRVASKTSDARRRLEDVYAYWGTAHCSVRILLINYTPYSLKESKLVAKYGFFERTLKGKDSFEELSDLNLEPYDVQWIFHRKHNGWYCGVEATLSYKVRIPSESRALDLILYWDITRGESNNPTVTISGNAMQSLRVSYEVANENTITPIITFNINR